MRIDRNYTNIQIPGSTQQRAEKHKNIESHHTHQKQTISHVPRHFNHKMEIEINQDIQRVVIKVVDTKSDKVIKVMPPVALQKVYAYVRRMIKELYPPTK